MAVRAGRDGEAEALGGSDATSWMLAGYKGLRGVKEYLSLILKKIRGSMFILTRNMNLVLKTVNYEL